MGANELAKQYPVTIFFYTAFESSGKECTYSSLTARELLRGDY